MLERQPIQAGTNGSLHPQTQQSWSFFFFFLILKVKETHKHSSMKNKLPTKEQKSKLSVELFFCSTKCRKTTAQYLINLGEKEHNPVISYHAQLSYMCVQTTESQLPYSKAQKIHTIQYKIQYILKNSLENELHQLGDLKEN